MRCDAISANLAEPMTHLDEIQQRDKTFKPFWWIDMICINQDDLDERSHRVFMMRSIFRTVSLVVAWLGPDRGEAGLLRDIQRPPAEHLGTWYLTLIRNFLNRPYWSLVWIIQELCVAREILLACGDQTAPWSVFRAQLRLPQGKPSRGWSIVLN
jgi:hypothetical protein